jgi:DNA-directed RNA polymerase specialized sigma24 family protein
MTAREQLLQEVQPASFAIAYRMLGNVSEAEDVVQEALLRLYQAIESGERIASPRAFVATVTTRLGTRHRWQGDPGCQVDYQPRQLAHLGPTGDFNSLLH